MYIENSWSSLTFSCFASKERCGLVFADGIFNVVLIYILLFLESLANSLAVLQELLGAFADTVVLLCGQIGRSEVVDTVLETSRDQVGVQSHEVLHLLLLNDLLKFLLFLNV